MPNELSPSKETQGQKSYNTPEEYLEAIGGLTPYEWISGDYQNISETDDPEILTKAIGDYLDAAIQNIHTVVAYNMLTDDNRQQWEEAYKDIRPKVQEYKKIAGAEDNPLPGGLDIMITKLDEAFKPSQTH